MAERKQILKWILGSLMDDRVPFLRKPFTPEELAAKVREVLQSAI